MAEPHPQPQNPTTNETELKRLRTYQSDVAEVLAKKNVTLSGIALAEGEKKHREPEPDATLPSPTFAPPPKILRLSEMRQEKPASFLINWKKVARDAIGVFLTAGVLFGAYLILRDGTPPAPLLEESPPVRAEEIPMTGGETRAAFIARVRERADALRVAPNDFRELTVRIGNAALSPTKLVALLQASAPPPLLRALGQLAAFGVTAGDTSNHLFLLFEVRSFEHAFDGMLSWEDTLLEDVGPLFGINPRDLSPIGTTTDEILGGSPAWRDIIVRNRDVRALFRGDGTVILLYSFLDKETLLITDGYETLRALLPRVKDGRLR